MLYDYPMIGHLAGTVIQKTATQVIVSVGGVGYLVATTPHILSQMDTDSSISLWTHLAVRETALDLYGFLDESELKLFQLLLTVSGIGPKSALGVLSIVDTADLRTAIARNDATRLIKISGIGKKTAEKIVRELHEKIGAPTDVDTLSTGSSDALDALMAMGYTLSEAREALKRVSKDTTNSADVVREALKQLSS